MDRVILVGQNDFVTFYRGNSQWKKAIEFKGEEYEKEKRNIYSALFGSRVFDIYYCYRGK